MPSADTCVVTGARRSPLHRQTVQAPLVVAVRVQTDWGWAERGQGELSDVDARASGPRLSGPQTRGKVTLSYISQLQSVNVERNLKRRGMWDTLNQRFNMWY